MPASPQDAASASLAWALSFARGYLALGMLGPAERTLKDLSPLLHCHPEVMSLHSHLLIARRRWRKVVTHARHAVQLFPDAAEYYVHAATALDMLGRRAAGRKVWASAPPTVRANGTLHLYIARFEARLGNVDAARDHIASAFDLDPRLRAVVARDPQLTAVL